MQINNELMMMRRIKRRKYIKDWLFADVYYLAVFFTSKTKKVVDIIKSDATPVLVSGTYLY